MYISRYEDGLLRNLQFFRTFHQASLHQSPINATSYMHRCKHAIVYTVFASSEREKCKQGIKLSPILSHSPTEKRSQCNKQPYIALHLFYFFPGPELALGEREDSPDHPENAAPLRCLLLRHSLAMASSATLLFLTQQLASCSDGYSRFVPHCCS